MNRLYRLTLPMVVAVGCALVAGCGDDSEQAATTSSATVSASTHSSAAPASTVTASTATVPATSHRGNKVSLRAYSIYPKVELWRSDARGTFKDVGKHTLTTRIATKQNGKLYRSLTNYKVKVRDGHDRIAVTDTSGNRDAWVQCQIYVNGKLVKTATGVGLGATARC